MPIARTPEAAQLSPAARQRLTEINQRCRVAIISGRSLDDLKDKVKISGLIYAGNHGLEIEGPGLRFLHDDARHLRSFTEDACRTLRSEFRRFTGVRVEYKGLTAAIHYRLAKDSEIPAVQAAVRKAVGPLSRYLQVTEGKKVFDLRPKVDWDKGAAAKWILKRLEQDEEKAIYIGDDRTDEDAFRSLTTAITIHVGTNPDTTARYSLRSPQEVWKLLKTFTNSDH